MGKCVVHPIGGGDARRVSVGAEAAAFLGLDPASQPTVEDALVASVLVAKGTCLIDLSVTLNGKPAIAGVQINGITTLVGGACYTDANGRAKGISSTATTVLSTPAYLDMASTSKSVPTPPGKIVTATLALNPPTAGETSWESNAAGVQFSPYADVMLSMCGGGGGGGGDYYGNGSRISGSAGGGGYAVSQKLFPVPMAACSIVIGEGGKGGIAANSEDRGDGTDGGAGGTTTAFGISVRGGSGGKGGTGGAFGYTDGNGYGAGNTSSTLSGTDGTVFEFNDTTRKRYGGGGSTGISGSQPGKDYGNQRSHGGGGYAGYGNLSGGKGYVAVKWLPRVL